MQYNGHHVALGGHVLTKKWLLASQCRRDLGRGQHRSESLVDYKCIRSHNQPWIFDRVKASNELCWWHKQPCIILKSPRFWVIEHKLNIYVYSDGVLGFYLWPGTSLRVPGTCMHIGFNRNCEWWLLIRLSPLTCHYWCCCQFLQRSYSKLATGGVATIHTRFLQNVHNWEFYLDFMQYIICQTSITFLVYLLMHCRLTTAWQRATWGWWYRTVQVSMLFHNLFFKFKTWACMLRNWVLAVYVQVGYSILQVIQQFNMCNFIVSCYTSCSIYNVIHYFIWPLSRPELIIRPWHILFSIIWEKYGGLSRQ